MTVPFNYGDQAQAILPEREAAPSMMYVLFGKTGEGGALFPFDDGDVSLSAFK